MKTGEIKSLRTIVLTGATGGLGQCLLYEICKLEDIELLCTYRNEEKFQKICINVKKDVKKYKTFYNDNYNTFCELISPNTNEVVIILNAFSIIPIKPIGEFETKEIDTMIDGNIKQIVHLLNKVVHFCDEKNKDLKIINLDSGASDFSLTGWGNYCAAKSYINAFLGVLALEKYNYKIVSVDPGIMDTDMQYQIRNASPLIFNKSEEFRNFKKNGILKRPQDIAQCIIANYIVDWKAINLREKIAQ